MWDAFLSSFQQLVLVLAAWYALVLGSFDWPEQILIGAASLILLASVGVVTRVSLRDRLASSEPAPARPKTAPHAARGVPSLLRASRGVLIGLGLITAMLNVLYLTGSFFMLEVYDRVVPSRSLPTLIGIALLALGLYTFQGFLDIVR